MASLGLKAIAYGADKIPDSWFEKVPGSYYKAKEEKRRKDEKARRDRKGRRNSESRSRRTPSRSPSADPHRRGESDDDADYGSRRGSNYAPDDGRRRRRNTDAQGNRARDWGNGAGFKPYNPADYVPASSGRRDEYPGLGSMPTRYMPKLEQVTQQVQQQPQLRTLTVARPP
ncbi:hypothetical protein LTR66_014434 [Elasticomyces elasticus]|nr:hypothetical protein LTR66_014434 [Elasticomyces elasticus]